MLLRVTGYWILRLNTTNQNN